MEDKAQFTDDAVGWAERWQLELKTARKALENFYTVGKEADEVLRDETPLESETKRRLCLYPSSMQTIGAMLFGRMPQASVTRKFADQNDDAARVASDMLERLLNCDIERTDDNFAEATRNAMMDWRGPGLGVVKHRYEVEFEDVAEVPAQLGPDGAELAPTVPATKRKASESVNTDYVYWRDFLWGMGAHTWPPPWAADCSQMDREALVKRFGDIGKTVPLNAKYRKKEGGEEDKSHPWDRADVWEIWDKPSQKVYWVVEGFPRCLDIKPDPLGLEGFFPYQRPLMANLTTSKLIPVSDYKYAQDLYRSVNSLTTRIDLLVKTVRLAGLYNKSAGLEVEKLVQGGENKLYPADDWAMFAENGGVQGNVVFLPLEQIVAVLATLRDMRREDIDLIYQVTGQSDIMRGQQTANGTPGEAQVKARFGSVRLQSWQDELARFASDGQRIRAEIVAKHFDPQTIIQHSNILQTPDAELAQQAVELIRSRFSDYRIEIKPEAINLTDFAALKEERLEVMSAIGAHLQVLQGLGQLGPEAVMVGMELMKVSLAGLRGGSAYEAIIDKAIETMKQKAAQAAANPQAAPPDPKVQAAQLKLQGDQMKAQSDIAREQAKLQADLMRKQADVQAHAMQERTQRTENVMEHQQKQMISNALRPPPAPGANGRGGMP